MRIRYRIFRWPGDISPLGCWLHRPRAKIGIAFYHAIEKHLGAVNTSGKDVRADAAEAAETMLNIISRRRVVNWTQRDDVQNEMRNDLDDYLFDVMRDGKGHPLTPDLMDEIIDRILSIARARLPD
jgi:type I restriction enzyme R subunit